MPISRRKFLRIAGSSAVVLAAAGGGAGGFALTRTPSAALEPWSRAGGDHGDPRMRALSHAILAPNPHNRQPWLVDLVGTDGIDLYCDRTRLLPETDPFSRQIVIGLGCFLELLSMAAAADGHVADIQTFPEGMPSERIDDRPIARIVLRRSESVGADPLFAQVFARRSNKEPYDTARPVATQALAALRAAAGDYAASGASNEPERLAELRALTWRAFEIEITTPRTYQESVRLMRIGKAEIEANPDGIDIGGPLMEALNLAGVMTRESVADPTSTAFAQGLAMFRDVMGSAMAHVWLITGGNTRGEQIAAGRAWVRVNLKAAELGLAIHPVSQALQEYPEMAELYQAMHAKLGATGGQRVQMLGRLGHGPAIDPSPRWPLEARMRTA
jgi:hypothetical protein